MTTNKEFISKAFEEADMDSIMEIVEFLQDWNLGVCGKHCPYQEDCDKAHTKEGWNCKLSDNDEMKIWLGLETRFC